jgi:hypothetical protein
MPRKAEKKPKPEAMDPSVGMHVEEQIFRSKFNELHSSMMEAAESNPHVMDLYVEIAASMAWNVHYFRENYPDEIKKIGASRMDWPVILTYQKKWFEDMYGCKLFDTQAAVHGLKKYINLACGYKYNINSVKYDSVAEVVFSVLIKRQHLEFRTQLESEIGKLTSDKAEAIRSQIIEYLPQYFGTVEWWDVEEFDDIVGGDIPSQKRRKIKQSMLRKLESILPEK